MQAKVVEAVSRGLTDEGSLPAGDQLATFTMAKRITFSPRVNPA